MKVPTSTLDLTILVKRGTISISVCYDSNYQTCNRYSSSKDCGDRIPCGPCLKGYVGENCGTCASGYYPLNGTNGHVDSITGEGVICISKEKP